MQNTIIYLIGFPGTGKYTIAKEICEQANVTLVDNHLICNPIFSIMDIDGVTPMPKEVWKNIAKIREVVFDGLVSLSPKDKSFVLTNVLTQNDPGDAEVFQTVANMAQKREANFIPIRLICDEEENLRRVAFPERLQKMKFMKPHRLKEIRKEDNVFKPNHKNAFTLDVTELPAKDAAKIILEYTQRC